MNHFLMGLYWAANYPDMEVSKVIREFLEGLRNGKDAIACDALRRLSNVKTDRLSGRTKGGL